MHRKWAILLLAVIVLTIAAAVVILINTGSPIFNPSSPIPPLINQDQQKDFPMFIETLRKRDYPVSNIVIEETLSPGANYQKFIASYKSDGLKIYGLLTIPDALKPESGFPAIVFLHGYINPKLYVTTQNYIDTQDSLARSGFITFKPDLRGHGISEGQALGAHFSEGYVVDTLNLISALKTYNTVDPAKIGLWGHSNGGEIALRVMVISPDIKAGVIWAGVVGSFEDMLETYRSRIPFIRQTPDLVKEKGLPSTNPEFWNKMDPYSYLKDIPGPIQLHQGTADPQIPIELPLHLKASLEKEGKAVEYYEYQGANHNLSGQSFNQAMQRSVEFFKKHL